MKRTLSLMLAAVMVLGLTACGARTDSGSEPASSAPEVSSEAPAELLAETPAAQSEQEAASAAEASILEEPAAEEHTEVSREAALPIC